MALVNLDQEVVHTVEEVNREAMIEAHVVIKEADLNHQMIEKYQEVAHVVDQIHRVEKKLK